MPRPATLLVLAVLLAAGAAGAAGAGGAALVAAGEGRVASVVDGDTLVLEGGEAVRLVGIQAPKLPLGRAGVAPWPLADEARAALARLALGRRVRLLVGGRERDRYGRRLAQLYRADDGLWLQGEMLSRGLARVYSFADNRALVGEMLALERAARARGRGLWANPFYFVRDAARPQTIPLGRFELVRGRVVAAARVKRWIYLNFGADWQRDFTARLRLRDRALFRTAGRDPLALAGHRVRVRGWTERYNGPMITLSHPEQIEILDR